MESGLIIWVLPTMWLYSVGKLTLIIATKRKTIPLKILLMEYGKKPSPPRGRTFKGRTSKNVLLIEELHSFLTFMLPKDTMFCFVNEWNEIRDP